MRLLTLAAALTLALTPIAPGAAATIDDDLQACAGITTDADACRRVIATASADMAAAPGAMALLARAVAHGALDDLDSALADTKRAAELAPDDAFVQRMHATLRARLKQWDAAMAGINRAIALEPSAQAYATRARIYLLTGEPGKSLADAEEAARLERRSVDAYFAIAFARFALGDTRGAHVALGQAVMLDPANAKALGYRGGLRHWIGDRRGGLADLDRAIELAPDDAELLLLRAYALFERDDDEVGLADIDRAIGPAGGVREFALLARANFRLSRAETGKAAADCAALDRAPLAVIEAHLCRASMETSVGNLTAALASYDSALQADSKSTVALIGRGTVHFMSGRFDAAFADAELAVRYKAADLNALMLRRDAALRAGLPDELATAVANLDLTIWPGPVVRFMLGQITAGELYAIANEPGYARQRLCMANYATGYDALLRGDRQAAIRQYLSAATECQVNSFSRDQARIELQRLGVTP